MLTFAVCSPSSRSHFATKVRPRHRLPAPGLIARAVFPSQLTPLNWFQASWTVIEPDAICPGLGSMPTSPGRPSFACGTGVSQFCIITSLPDGQPDIASSKPLNGASDTISMRRGGKRMKKHRVVCNRRLSAADWRLSF